MTFSDPVEKIIADALDRSGIEYDHDHSSGRLLRHPGITLDFYLPKYGIWIECKQFYSEKISRQLQQDENVIVVQGRKAAHAFAQMIEK